MRYLIPCFLFLANSEVVSSLALVILMIVFLCDVWKARPNHDAE